MQKRKPKEYQMTPARKVIRTHSGLLAVNLLKLRTKKNITQKQLADKMDIPQTVVSYLESGWGNPTLFYLVKISTFFKVSIADLFKK